MTDASKTFSDDIRKAHRAKNSAPMIGEVPPEREVSVASRKFGEWIRGEGRPGAGDDTFEDDITDATRPSTGPTEASIKFAQWAGAVGDDEQTPV